jgi:L-malate glycosyltransferase
LPAIDEPVPVLLMARELGPGGSERQLTEIAKRLDRSRFLPMVGYFRGGMRLDELVQAGIETVQVDVSSFKSAHTLGAARRFVRFLKQRRVVLVHTFDYPLTSFAAPLARLARVPVVLSSQRGHRDLIPNSYRGVIRVTDLVVDGIVVNCRAMEEHLVQEEDVPRRKIRLCYNGVDYTKFQSPSDCSTPNAGDLALPTVGCVSVLRPEKRLDLLLSAVSSLSPEFPELRTILVGDGPEKDRLCQSAKQLDLLHRCLFHPAQADVAHWLRKIGIFVLPSSTEALSNSLMEAMASGCAVIASRVGGNPELVTDEETGLLFQSGNAHDLAQKIRLLLTSADTRLRLGCNAKRLIRDRFRLDHATACMGAIYGEYLSSKPLGE